jgi:hypothetical protein
VYGRTPVAPVNALRHRVGGAAIVGLIVAAWLTLSAAGAIGGAAGGGEYGPYPPYGPYGKTTLCHKGVTITVSDNAVPAHLAEHGDTLGPCPPGSHPGQGD